MQACTCDIQACRASKKCVGIEEQNCYVEASKLLFLRKGRLRYSKGFLRNSELGKLYVL